MSTYDGFREVALPDDELVSFYENNRACKDMACLTNEYLIVKNQNGTVVDQFKWDGEAFSRVPYTPIRSRFCGEIKPRNIQQQLAIDMLYDRNITVKVLAGRFGTGKDFLMSSAAISLIEQGAYDRIVWVRNNVEVKNSKPIGHLPGDYNDKLLPFAMPLADHLGGAASLDMMIGQGKVELVHLGFIRGRDIKNAIIMCSEAENMTREHIQLLLGRVGEGSSLWMNGDYKQVDGAVFRENNGLMLAIDKLKGHPRFGFVRLLKTERSETAAMADLLD